MATFIIQAFVAYTIGRIAQTLLEEDPETPLVDEKPSTSSTKGSFAPLIIGEYRIGPVIVWVGHRSNIPESGGEGGKGFSGGGGSEQNVWYEEAIHFLCVGPAFSLRTIWSNGEKLLFNGGASINSDTHPSGTTIDAFSADGTIFKGNFQIFWGEASDPVDSFISVPSRLGILSRWPYQCHINWTFYRLGGFAVWPTLEYEIQVRPFSLTGSQLTNVANWGAFGFGDPATFEDILEVGNSIRFTPPQIKVEFDKTADFLDGNLTIIQGQPGIGVNRTYLLDVSTFNPADVVVKTTQTFAPMLDGTIERNINNWIKSTGDGITVTAFNSLGGAYGEFPWPEGESPAEGTIYRCIENQDSIIVNDVHIRTLTVDVSSNGGNTFSRGAQELNLWIRCLQEFQTGNTLRAEWVEIGFVNNGTDPIPANAAYSRYTIIDGLLVVTNFNGARGTASGDSTGIWTKTSTKFKTEGGETDGSFSEIDARTVFVRWNSGDLLDIRVDIYYAGKRLEPDTYIAEDAGTLITGTTTIKLNDTLVGAFDDLGGIGAMVPGTGRGGANMAYLLEQLLFETFPHGAGLSRDDWDIPSLDQLAQDTEDEEARIMMIATRGKSIKGMIALLLQDMHAFISWNPVIGKYVFGLMRDPGATPVPNIPIKAILSPAPEIQTLHQFATPNMIVFGFVNRDKGYRTDTAPLDDDASASAFNNRIIKNVKISVATDHIFAKQIAERRQTEDLIPATIYKIAAGREARLLTAGASFTTDDIDEPLRLIDLELDTESSKVKITAVTDIFAIASETQLPQNFGGGLDSQPRAALEDLATTIWELSPFLSQDIVSVAIPRIRAGSYIGNAVVLISTDDISYNQVKGAPFLASGGTLTSGIPADSKLELRGIDAPSFSALGEDILNIGKTLSDENWKTGKQLALIGTEVFYLKQIIPMGGGVYHLDGLIRARLGTNKEAHSTGDTVFIFSRDSIKRIVDPLLIPDSSIFIKTIPKGVSAADVTAKNPAILGTGIKPLSVSAVRTLTGSPSYITGEDITLRWNFHFPLSLSVRGGAGFQTAGEAMGEPLVGPQVFRVTIIGGLIGRIIETTVPTITYTNAQMLADNNSSEFDPDFRIEMIYNGYSSTPVSYVVTLV